MAKANPSGTRTRRAIADQLTMTLPQQLPRRGNHLPGADFKQAAVGPEYVLVAGVAGRTAQHDGAGAERAVARGIGRPEDSDYRNFEGRCQVHGAGIAA